MINIPKTIEVEMFLYKTPLLDKLKYTDVRGMEPSGWVLLGSKIITLDTPTVDAETLKQNRIQSLEASKESIAEIAERQTIAIEDELLALSKE